MASVGHVYLGACAAVLAGRGGRGLRYPWSSVILMSAFSLLPDADVLGFPLGIAYGDPFGHRGATHSLVFAAVVALVCATATRVARPTESASRVFALTLLVVTSHGLLDMLTDGGLGVALFWPSNERLFFPWHPIPVAPIGRGMFSARGLHVVLVETAYFAPLLAGTAWLARRWKRGMSAA